MADRLRLSLHCWAAEQAQASGPIYTYYFDQAIPWPEHPEFGAFHTAEVPYVFRTLDRLPRPWTQDDRTLSDRMVITGSTSPPPEIPMRWDYRNGPLQRLTAAHDASGADVPGSGVRESC
jgi:carboxylesterase type B